MIAVQYRFDCLDSSDQDESEIYTESSRLREIGAVMREDSNETWDKRVCLDFKFHILPS